MASALHRYRTAFWILGIAAVAGAYFYGTWTISSQVNTDPNRSDQGTYRRLARRAADPTETRILPRSRMPGYAMIHWLFLKPDTTEQEFFDRGKQINLVISVALIVFVFFAFRAHVSLHAAINATLIATFTMILFKAPYVQPALLLYGLYFLGFLMMIKCLRDPGIIRALALGVVVGLGYYVKGTMLPALFAFLAFALVNALLIFRSENAEAGPAGPDKRKVITAILVPLLIFGGFFATVYPYCSTSKRVFDSYFYDSNSIQMWCDTKEEADVVKDLKLAYHPISEAETPPGYEVPSAAKYFREHSIGQILAREFSGMTGILNRLRKSYGFLGFFLIYTVLAGMILYRSPEARRLLTVRARMPALLLATLIAGYLALFSWFAVFSTGPRFMLIHFLPVLFSLVWFVDQQGDKLPDVFRLHFLKRDGGKSPTYTLRNAYNTIITILIVSRIPTIISKTVLEEDGGN